MTELDQTRPAPEDYVPTGGRERAPARRGRLLGVGAVTVLLIAAVIIVARLADDPKSEGDVRAGPAAELPAIPTSVPLPSRIELQPPDGWQTLLADGEQLVVGTAPLEERDLLLALLARDDAVFTAFPPTAAVFVVGGDRLKAKYVGIPPSAVVTPTENGVEIVEESPGFVGPGPARAFGPPTLLAGGVTVRLGDLPQSSSTLAAYIGPQAPESATQEAEAMAATVRLRPYDRALVPPPPPGSRPGFDQGGVDTAAEDLVPVASVHAAGLTYTARAGADCADVVAVSSSVPLVGGCRPRPATAAAIEVVASGSALGPPPPPPGESYGPGVVVPPGPMMIVLARVGSDATRVTAVLVDGREVDGTVGADGWAVVATDGRAFLLEARDDHDAVVARAPIG